MVDLCTKNGVGQEGWVIVLLSFFIVFYVCFQIFKGKTDHYPQSKKFRNFMLTLVLGMYAFIISMFVYRACV